MDFKYRQLQMLSLTDGDGKTLLIADALMMIMIVIERLSLRLLQSPQCAANCLQHVRSSGQDAAVCNILRAYHMQNVVCHVV